MDDDSDYAEFYEDDYNYGDDPEAYARLQAALAADNKENDGEK